MEAFDPRDVQQAVALGVHPVLFVHTHIFKVRSSALNLLRPAVCGALQVSYELQGHSVALVVLEYDVVFLFNSYALPELALTMVGPWSLFHDSR